MSFLRQLFRITTRRDPTIQKLVRPNHKTLVTVIDYEKEGEEVQADNFFEYIIGYNDVKKFLRMSINTEEPVHILLIGFSKDNVYQINQREISQILQIGLAM